jgi:outer membrane protein insertion porin family
MSRSILLTCIVLISFFTIPSNAQPVVLGGDTLSIDYSNPKEYIIRDVKFADSLVPFNKDIMLSTTGLMTGMKIRIPGDDLSKAISNLWKQGMFEDIKIVATKVEGNYIWLMLVTRQKPVIIGVGFKAGQLTKHESKDLTEKLDLKGHRATESEIHRGMVYIKEYFVDKGYPDVTVVPEIDPTKDPNSVTVKFDVTLGPKVKIGEIDFKGNNEFKDARLWRVMKETKRKRWWNPFNSGKLIEDDFEKDKTKIVDKYKDRGYRDAHIIKDSVYRISRNRYGIDIYISEGHKYYFRNITWVGNSKYTSKDLTKALGIKKGDIYNQGTLDSRLYMNANGTDVSSLYLDDGYLFFNLNPVEVQVENDSIDLEIRIVEGKQATINKVTVIGNTKTNDRVIMRELHTRPGQLFRRSDIMRSQRELAQLGYFDPEKMQVNPIPHPENGTVDIEYVVEEKPSDQLELSGGFGAGRVIGTLGVSFNNFSARNMFHGSAWAPLPSGDGQKLSIRAQSNGLYYQSYNFSFTEPWLGGKKPHSLTFSFYESVINATGQKKKITDSEGNKVDNPLHSSINIANFSLGYGTRMKKPDDYFQFYGELNYQHYTLDNYKNFVFTDGVANNLNLRLVLSRNSVDQPLYDFPTSGSNITLTGQATLPYHLFAFSNLYQVQDYSVFSSQDKYRWIEYYKFKFTSSWFTRLLGKDRKHSLVLNTRIGYGLLGAYTPELASPFERFYLGGSGLTGFYSFDGREIIALRGYSDNTVFTSPNPSQLSNPGATAIAKYTMEFRYPLSLNPQALIYGLAFAEAGNSWTRAKDFNPFSVKRSVGVGFRIFLPMFGLLGLDYGWRLDDIYSSPTMQKGQFHFTIGMNLGEL